MVRPATRSPAVIYRTPLVPTGGEKPKLSVASFFGRKVPEAFQPSAQLLEPDHQQNQGEQAAAEGPTGAETVCSPGMHVAIQPVYLRRGS